MFSYCFVAKEFSLKLKPQITPCSVFTQLVPHRTVTEMATEARQRYTEKVRVFSILFYFLEIRFLEMRKPNSS